MSSFIGHLRCTVIAAAAGFSTLGFSQHGRKSRCTAQIHCGQKCLISCNIIMGTPELFAASEDCVCVSCKQKPTVTCSVWMSRLHDPNFLLGASGKNTTTSLSFGSLYFAQIGVVRASIDVPFELMFY